MNFAQNPSAPECEKQEKGKYSDLIYLFSSSQKSAERITICAVLGNMQFIVKS